MRTGRRSLLLNFSRILGGIVLASAPRRAIAAEVPEASGAGRSKLPPGATSHFAEVNGIRMHYVRSGFGPLVLLLHGWPQTWFAWNAVIPRLAARYCVIAPDLRGCGLSERTADGYDKRTIAEDLHALIIQAGFKRAHVVGHDMGGKAAYVLAHLYPAIVSKLILADCLLPGSENMDPLRGGAWHYGFHMALNLPEMLTKGRERAYISAQIKAWSHKKDAVGEAAIDEYARHYAGRGGMTAGFNYYRALRGDAKLAETLRQQKLAMPVMAIAGRHGVGDKLAEAIGRETDQLTAVIAGESGHFVVEEDPEFFLAQLESFIAS